MEPKIDLDEIYGEQEEDIHGAEQEIAAIPDTPGCLTEEERMWMKYIRVSLRLEDEAARVKAQCEAILKGIEQRRKGLEYIYGGMARHVTAAKLGTGKSKSLKTPWGTVGYRKTPAHLKIRDAAGIIQVAKASKMVGWFKTKEEPSQTGLLDYFKRTGEVPFGCEVEPAFEKFYVKGMKGEAGADNDPVQPD